MNTACTEAGVPDQLLVFRNRQRSLFISCVHGRATQLEDLRRRLYDEYGLTFGAAYNQLYQHTSATAPTALHDQALGAWAQASMTWTPLDRGGDHEGTLVVRGAFRGSLPFGARAGICL